MSDVQLRDCTDPASWWPHLAEAAGLLGRGGLAVIPTDTVYGIAADAFTPSAVEALLAAKGRGRQMPPPVLIGDVRTLDGLAGEVPQSVRDLVAAFWPGPLTLILNAQPSLAWDLGETHGTVALRMPDDECALALLRRTGPLAVSSANRTGSAAALTAADAAEQLGTAVQLYLDGGPSQGAMASTIVDATGATLRIVREGALSAATLGAVVPELMPEPERVEPERVEPERVEPERVEPERVEVEPDEAPEPVAAGEPAVAEPEPAAETETTAQTSPTAVEPGRGDAEP